MHDIRGLYGCRVIYFCVPQQLWAMGIGLGSFNAILLQIGRVENVNRDEIEHEPVLFEPMMSIVAPQPGEIVVDATVGHGGHAQLLAEAIG